jgi:hypothetical protein
VGVAEDDEGGSDVSGDTNEGEGEGEVVREWLSSTSS